MPCSTMQVLAAMSRFFCMSWFDVPQRARASSAHCLRTSASEEPATLAWVPW